MVPVWRLSWVAEGFGVTCTLGSARFWKVLGGSGIPGGFQKVPVEGSARFSEVQEFPGSRGIPPKLMSLSTCALNLSVFGPATIVKRWTLSDLQNI